MTLEQFVELSVADDLLTRYLKGDRQSGEQLLINPAYRRSIQQIAQKHTRGSSVSWEDAVQNAHMKNLLAVKAGKFRQGGVEEFYRWAVTVARCAIIDLIRKERQCNWMSLDQNIPGTDLPLSETIPDEFNLLDSVERADLILRVVDAITDLDQRYPGQGFLKLWLGRVQGRTQVELAIELGLTQGAVSKRWKELSRRIAEVLGLLPYEDVKQEMQAIRKHKAIRTRSEVQW